MIDFSKTIISLLICMVLIVPGCRVGPYVGTEEDTVFIRSLVETIDPTKDKEVGIVITGVKADGSPLPDALVYIGTDQGQVEVAGEPSDVVMLQGGSAQVTIRTQSQFTGEALTVTAKCGSAKVDPEELVIPIVVPDITKLFITADPLLLPPGGGTSQITVNAVDSQSNPVPGKKIWLSTTAGNLSPSSPIEVDGSGRVEAELTTSLAATVTALYNDLTAAVDIGIIENNPPEAIFLFSPTEPTITTPNTEVVVYFDASLSKDPDAGDYIQSYKWVFGDGEKATGMTVSHTYSPTVTTVYNVTLTVSDRYGLKTTATNPVTVTVGSGGEGP